MRNISTWAKQYVLASRILIFFIHVLLILLAYYLSINIQFNFSFFSLNLVLSVLITCILLNKRARKSYSFRKTIHLITSTCFFLITIFFIKQNFAEQLFYSNVNAFVISDNNSSKNATAEQILESVKYRDKSTLTKEEKRILKKELKKQLVAYGKSAAKHDGAPALRAVIIILTMIAVIGLTMLLSLLACSIACNGYGVLAILVFVAGIAGILFGFRFLLKHLDSKKKKPVDKSITTFDNNEAMPLLIL